ncbi:ribonuclease H-like domain-containing protein [Tanacetum coccineum]|uniref:Ribonuclease H-like domain-containing protein n=1 Tax=Tanacetum coccineum TaxID=301880 RepID=A0ABQ5AI93_9ASTR
MDDLYNNLKVYEAEIKSQSSSNSQNVAFVSSENTSSTNEAVNTAHDVSVASLHGKTSSSTYADDVIFSFFANQSNSPQLDNEDLEQIDTADFEEMDLKWQVECYNCHRRGHFARECRVPRNQGNRNGDNTRRVIPVETPANALVVTNGIAYQLGLESLEARIAVHQKNEAVYEEDIAFLKYDVKTGIGFGSQMNENELHDSHLNKSKVFESASDSSVNECEDDNDQVNDRYKAGEGYHAVPPPYTRKYMPLIPDLSFVELDESVFRSVVRKSTTSVSETETSKSKTGKDFIEETKIVRHNAPIIEEWESDSDDGCVIRPSIEQNKPSYAKINFVKSDENTRKSVIKQHTNRQAENLRKSQSSKVDKRDWNGMMAQKLGDGYEFKKKACFVCGNLNHLIKDCNFYENKLVGKSMLNNLGRVTGQREVRPVWNNAQRVNHQNKLTYPHSKRNFVPTTVVTKSRQVPVNAAKQSSPRAATSISTARHVNTAAPKPKVNDVLPIKYSYFKAHSPVRRPFNQKSAAKTNNFNEKVNTAKVNNITTAGPKAVVSTTEGKRENTVKVIHNILLHDQGIFDSGCSRHMTGNKSFLTDYQDIDGGFVAFAGSPKGGKITGKGKIRTGKLDFKDVYFVKELKFNLFSVSQMCDKKNSVLFTKTECLILSHNFKLLDESQVLLKVPRQDNMYSFDLKNVVPSGGLTCLFEKATIDESNWHKRLGHINFKSMNKLVRGNLVRGLPSKIFKNDHSCVACRKGKQHKSSCKTKINRVLVTKPHNKTPYELLLGRPPSISFMSPFGCLVTILNTFDPLSKFDRKADEGFLIGYSINSKAFRVSNTRTRKVEDNLHINFLENKPNVAGSGPEWLFDIDSLTKSMN